MLRLLGWAPPAGLGAARGLRVVKVALAREDGEHEELVKSVEIEYKKVAKVAAEKRRCCH